MAESVPTPDREDTERCTMGQAWTNTLCTDPACPVHGDLHKNTDLREHTGDQGDGERVTLSHDPNTKRTERFIPADQHKRELEAKESVIRGCGERNRELAGELEAARAERDALERAMATELVQEQGRVARIKERAAQIARNTGGEVEGNG